MANKNNDNEDLAGLIAAGILAVGAIIGTFIVLKAIGSFQEGQVITENETASLKPTPGSERNYRYGTCDNCGATDVKLCNKYFGNTSLPENHCFASTCGNGLHYESLGMCLECAKWDSFDDDD